jgi:phosphohistidine phosphatase
MPGAIIFSAGRAVKAAAGARRDPHKDFVLSDFGQFPFDSTSCGWYRYRGKHMRLYIVRHAIAAPHGTPGVQDDDRSLTEEGIKKMRQAAVGLRNLEYIPELIFTSPLIRARQTAEILLDVLGKGIELKIMPSLAPSGPRRDLYQSIASSQKRLNSLMLVGHQPSLGQIASELICGSPECSIELKKGGVCSIELTHGGNSPQGTLISLLTPSILRTIAVRMVGDL